MVCLSGTKIINNYKYFQMVLFFEHFHQPSHLNIRIAQFPICQNLQTFKPYDMWHYCIQFGNIKFSYW